jgi:hypothetical protein
MYDAGNKKDVRRLEKQAKLEEQQRREIVTGIMSVAPGRRWMCELLEHCHVFSTSFSDATNRMAFMEGQREVGLHLLGDIMSACPDHYVTMMRERNERSTTADARNRKDADGRDQGRGPDDDAASDDTADEYYYRDFLGADGGKEPS